MREQIIKTEVAQFKRAISETYNKAASKPQLTLIVVNKRIHQRFFYQDRDQLFNPPAGALIDTKLVSSSTD